ncbi:TonB-dependent receptor plug domain-containing protein, partial [Phenylobacterium sp.]|uniref:TonB-dependent receptor plug domain-containing protein n=1 Tax=Phenylobacterium sp. TaxID=1871053 RepID=UPI002FE36594
APTGGAVATGADTASGAAPATLEELQVTGTHIRGGRTASPLLVIDRAALDRSGHATVAAALGALPQNFSGVANEGANTTGADRIGRNIGYGSSVNLRGLGPDATLVLVNGRRLAGAGSFGDFADLSTLPSAAVQRVEVLLDGASALYGADAVGGVVNIIMRRDYDGAETRLTAGVGTDGEPTELQLSQAFGRRWDGGGVLLAYELRRRSRLSGDDRAFAADADLRPFGGSDQRLTNAFPGNILTTGPSGTLVGWAIPAGQDGVGLRPQDLIAGQANLGNQRRGVDILPRQDLHALYVAADQQLGEAVELTADLRYGRRDFDVRLSSSIANIAVPRANPFFVSPTGAASHTVAYSFAEEIGNARLDGRQESLALTLGATARLPRDWRTEGYLAFAQEETTTHGFNTVNTALLAEATGAVADRPETAFSAPRDGYFNPFSGTPGANSPALLAAIAVGSSDSRTRGQVMSANLQADGTLFALPGGALKAALGGQLRRETLVRTGTSFVSTPAPVAQPSADVARSVVAAFLELRAPLVGPANRRRGLERLEVSLAGRVERYGDVGTTANPKAGLLWAPLEGLSLRATYGRSFRAPALREVHDAQSYSGSLLPLGTARIRTLLLNGGNPDLRPETATTWTAGADWAPAALPGLRLGVTGFEVRFEDRIGKPVQENILNALSDPALTSFITRISPADNAADRARIEALLASPALIPASAGFPPEAYGAIADNRYVNTADLRVSGVDLT